MVAKYDFQDNKSLEVIDFHAFLGRWKSVQLSSSLDGLLASMCNAGISRTVIITTESEENVEVLKVARRFRDRFFFFYWYNPENTSALDFIRKNRKDIYGVKFHPSHIRTRLDDESVIPLLDFCEREKLPLLVHCGRWKEFSDYSIVLDVAHRWNCNFALAHMGGVTLQLRKKTIEDSD